MAIATVHPGWTIRRGLASDYPAIGRLYETVYGEHRAAESLAWLYDANPAGRCELWVAEDDRSGRLLAVRPVFPWRLRIGGQDMVVGQAGDAMTHPDCRGRGIFTALVQCAWSELRERGVPFTFSFSNPGALSVYKKAPAGSGSRSGTHEVLRFRRLVRPLSLQPWLPERFRNVDSAWQALQRWWLALPSGMSVFRVRRFDQEFDQLWKRQADQHGILTVRDSAYLNWRYLQAPAARFQTLGLRHDGELVGYVTLEIGDDGDGWIADLFGPVDRTVVPVLVRTALDTIAASGGTRASMWTATEMPFFGVLRRMGFVPRGSRFPMAVHVYHDGAATTAALDGRRWWAWYGDRDVESLVGPVSGHQVGARS